MEDYKNGDERRAVLLEGVYNGVAGKLEDVRKSVQREIQYNSAQQAGAYEALLAELRAGVNSVLAELRYVAQQSSAIYDYNQRERVAACDNLLEEMKTQTEQAFVKFSEYFDERIAARDSLLEEMRAQTEQAFAKFTEYLDERIEAVTAAIPSPEAFAVDYEKLADAVAERLKREEPQKEEAPKEKETDAPFDEGFDYDLLAEKIATAIPEVDCALIADNVVSALPQTDEKALAEHVAAALPQVDESALADKVAEAIAPTDYDLIAERVIAALAQDTELKLGEESVQRIAKRVAELIGGDESDLDRIARSALAAEQPAQPRAAVAAETALSNEDGETPDGMTTRYKRSFVAKIIMSEADVKEYYSELKNALLGYQRVNSQVSWTNDRFSLKGETLAKIGVRGKTLCLYLALNPQEFPESVYHQKFAGDAKMYEKTPMMLKIRSGVALKRALRLIALLMEKNGAAAAEGERIDYVARYAYRSEQELLNEGLIKTAIVEKSDLDF